MADAVYHKITQELAESRDFPSESDEETFHDPAMESGASMIGDPTPKSTNYERLEPDSAPPPRSCTKLTATLVVALVVIAILILAIVAAVVPKGEDKFPYSSVRLPKDVVPETYDLFMHPNLTTQQFSGRVVINVRIAKPTSAIILHMQRISLSDIQK
ncbi:leucyl-cystinyl aminopeptidase-like [Ptychodera flava]|uniref:leucyl-cystinyl aminopeptidase-like n=1 Tax=Ptychodera flava TaxID=63121 RepID=UPI00396A826F